MSGPDLDALYAAAEAEAVDTLMKRRFGVESRDDLSGMFTGRSSLAPAPTPADAGNEPTAPTMPVLYQGPRAPAAADDAAIVDAYVRRYFPGAVE